MAQAALPETDIAVKLDAAGDLVAKGWYQGGYTDAGGLLDVIRGVCEADCFCALGAIGLVTGKIPDGDDELVEALASGLGFPLMRDGASRIEVENSVSNWNDAPNRTQDEVVAAFRKAAELARSKVAA